MTAGGKPEVHKFCYPPLGDVLHCEAGMERPVTSRVAKAWERWRDGELVR